VSAPRGIAAFFGGYRQTRRQAVTGHAYLRFFEQHHNDEWHPYCNFSKRRLSVRWRNAIAFMDGLPRPIRAVDICGYSMGSHLAILFALRCRELRVPKIQVTLLAPDPKYGRNKFDRGNGDAFADAKDLWQVEVPGDAMEAAVKRLRLGSRLVCWYSRGDTTAVWRGNVARLVRLDGRFLAAHEVRKLRGKRRKRRGTVHELLFTEPLVDGSVRADAGRRSPSQTS
jgi:pimeloyl-ACP methyl ester carboxylesterase